MFLILGIIPYRHSRNEDHFDKITGIVPVPDFKIFVTASFDNSVKVWSHQNELLRTVDLRFTIHAICGCTRYGDLVLGLKDNLEILEAQTCTALTI
jgi:WD40 repeat protein